MLGFIPGDVDNRRKVPLGAETWSKDKTAFFACSLIFSTSNRFALSNTIHKAPARLNTAAATGSSQPRRTVTISFPLSDPAGDSTLGAAVCALAREIPREIRGLPHLADFLPNSKLVDTSIPALTKDDDLGIGVFAWFLIEWEIKCRGLEDCLPTKLTLFSTSLEACG